MHDFPKRKKLHSGVNLPKSHQHYATVFDVYSDVIVASNPNCEDQVYIKARKVWMPITEFLAREEKKADE